MAASRRAGVPGDRRADGRPVAGHLDHPTQPFDPRRPAARVIPALLDLVDRSGKRLGNPDRAHGADYRPAEVGERLRSRSAMANMLPESIEPYENISSKAYEHPADRAATAALKAV